VKMDGDGSTDAKGVAGATGASFAAEGVDVKGLAGTAGLDGNSILSNSDLGLSTSGGALEGAGVNKLAFCCDVGSSAS
jgi:hypothetical protein